MGLYVSETNISIPIQQAEEILIKLEQSPRITSVNGKLTTLGIELYEEFNKLLDRERETIHKLK